jgi:hypothetical protein
MEVGWTAKKKGARLAVSDYLDELQGGVRREISGAAHG